MPPWLCQLWPPAYPRTAALLTLFRALLTSGLLPIFRVPGSLTSFHPFLPSSSSPPQDHRGIRAGHCVDGTFVLLGWGFGPSGDEETFFKQRAG